MLSELQWKETEINKRPRRQKEENIVTAKISKREEKD